MMLHTHTYTHSSVWSVLWLVRLLWCHFNNDNMSKIIYLTHFVFFHSFVAFPFIANDINLFISAQFGDRVSLLGSAHVLKPTSYFKFNADVILSIYCQHKKTRPNTAPSSPGHSATSTCKSLITSHVTVKVMSYNSCALHYLANITPTK